MATITLESGKRVSVFNSGEQAIHDKDETLLVRAKFNEDNSSAVVTFIERNFRAIEANHTIPNLPLNREHPTIIHKYYGVTASATIKF